MAYRIAKSLDTLRSQFNQQFPNRNKTADGWIGDAAHASRSSDHNPWVKDGSTGIVTALDITHDPRNGVDIATITEHMRLQRDSRIKYVICNARIFSSTTSPWQWRTYTGSNPHRSHFHVSVNSTKGHYDNTTQWNIGQGGSGPEAIEPDEPGLRPVLRINARGEHVRTVQRLLHMTIDGSFGTHTQAAVKGFQVGRALKPDGIVDALTWGEFDELEQIPTNTGWQRSIMATTFGGGSDPNNSAYPPYDEITDDELSVALPYSFGNDERPQIDVVSQRTGKRVTCDVRDKGPWMIDNAYWLDGSRPIAETCFINETPLPSGPNEGKVPSNGAGIDLSPAASQAIGLNGLELVDWAIAETKDEES